MRPALRLASAITVVACALPVAQLAGTQTAQAAPQASEQTPSRAAVPSAPPAGIVAAAGELVNASTGRWMWSRGLSSKRPIASITKVMAAIVVLAAGDLSRKIKVTQSAVQYAQQNSAGSAGLHAGDVLTARELLEGMLLPSGADAAYLLANTYGPGWRSFVRKMNDTASRLGMTHTHFANFDGLPWPTPTATYSTPRDLIIMGEAAMKLTGFRQIVRQRSLWIAATSQHHRYYWKNTDLLLNSYPGAVGIKTGFTTAAGYCLLFEAERGSRELMGVVLDSTDTDTAMRYTAAARLLNWGFANLAR